MGAAASGNAGKGTYELRVAGIPDDYVGNASTTKVIAIDETVHGLVHLAQDTDWFKVGLSAETTTKSR